MTSTRWLLLLVVAVAAASFLLGFWPLAAVAIVALGWVGRGWWAPPMGLLFDLAYGAPTNSFFFLALPFTLLALAAIVARYVAERYFFDRASPDTL